MASAPTVLEGPDLAAGIACADVHEGRPTFGHAAGVPILLVRRGDLISAVSGACTHWHSPLKSAQVAGDRVYCPWHHACFNLDTGAVVGGPTLDPLPVFRTLVEHGRVRVLEARTFAPLTPPTEAPSSVVIVGAGAAGAVCAETLRAEGYSGRVSLVGDEAPVDRPNLSKDYLAGKAEPAWMPLRTSEFYSSREIDLTIDDPVSAIDTMGHQVRLRGGTNLGYGALVIATGAAATALTIPGATLPHVLRLRTLADADAIIARAQTTRGVVVIGASFIGLEVAGSLRTRGLDVAVVAPEPVPMAAALGAEVGGYIRGLHESNGVVFHMGVRPMSIGTQTVTLSDGRVLAAGLVIVGVGVTPRTELAAAAGLEVERGIVVDQWLRTSHPNIYAAGDACRHPYHGGLVRIEHWAVAMAQGRAVARTILARGEPYAAVPYFWSQHYAVAITVIGSAEGWDRVDVHGKLADGGAIIAYRRGNRIVAVGAVGDAGGTIVAAESALQSGDEDALERIVLGGAS